MTVYNDIVRRPHLPREREVRRIMCNTGIDITLYGGSRDYDEEEAEAEVAVEAEAEALGQEEQGESEVEGEAEDPCP